MNNFYKEEAGKCLLFLRVEILIKIIVHLYKGDGAAINSEGAAIGPSLWCDNSDGAAIQACGRLWRRRDWSRAADLVLSVADGAAETGWNPG
ncbi:hypothetical protein CASFOL_030734 [Castilleja foliolosa]|uniref:Cellulase n=1 Tax=Castilleja foliolosa TaxID=1961234 RepID=A0ABD3C663_9LAMI